MTPSSRTSTPELASPATTAASRNSPVARFCGVGAEDGRGGHAQIQGQRDGQLVPSDPPDTIRTKQPTTLTRFTHVAPPLVCVDVWVRRRAGHLPLGVLRRLPGLLQAVLLALLDPGVPGHETGLLQRRAVLRVDQHQRPGHAEAQRAGLPGDATAGDPGHHVELTLAAERHERLVDQLLVHLVREVHVERAAVDQPLAGPGHDADPGDGLLAAAGAVRVPGYHRASYDGPPRRVLSGLGGVLRRRVRAVLVGREVRRFRVVLDGGTVYVGSGLSHGVPRASSSRSTARSA